MKSRTECVLSPGAVREEDGISQLPGEIEAKKQEAVCRKIKIDPAY